MSDTTAEEAEDRQPGSSVDFVTLVLSMRENALLLLGLASPGQTEVAPDLEGARIQIDMLSVVRQKSRGNLDDDESRLIDSVLYELRMAWVEARKAQDA